jgi:hypothetical protein
MRGNAHVTHHASEVHAEAFTVQPPGALPSTRWQDFTARVALSVFGVRLPIDYPECIPTRAADLNPTENEY